MGSSRREERIGDEEEINGQKRREERRKGELRIRKIGEN